jgi:hypothetical protein
VSDVDDRGAAEWEAEDRLRSVVLVEHEQAGAAWYLRMSQSTGLQRGDSEAGSAARRFGSPRVLRRRVRRTKRG